MKRKPLILKLTAYILLAALLVFGFVIFFPRTYSVPEAFVRPGTQYWNLPNGDKIGYTFIAAKGPKKPYPVIYLHGGPGGHITDHDIGIFSSFADSGYDVYLYDQAGSGQSARSADIEQYTVHRHIEDLDAIIQKIGTQKIMLIGQSWGAILATLFATAHADKIDKLILTSPGPVYPVHPELTKISPPGSIQLKAPFYSNQQGNTMAGNIRTKAMVFFATKLGVKIATDKEADNFANYQGFLVNRSTVCDTINIPPIETGSGFYAQVMTFNDLLKTSDPRPAIRRLNIPVLVLKGTCDNQPWGYTKEYLDLFTHSEIAIIPGAGHFISVEQPQLYTKTILSFLNR